MDTSKLEEKKEIIHDFLNGDRGVLLQKTKWDKVKRILAEKLDKETYDQIQEIDLQEIILD